MRLPPFSHHAAADLNDALAEAAAGSVLYTGGTELLAAMGMGLMAPQRLVSLRRVEELRGIRVNPAEPTWIGATTTHHDVARSEALRAAVPMLTRVARTIGNPRVRAVGTVGGNLAFGEPRSDLATALMALDASVTLASVGSTRSVEMDQFCIDAYETALTADEAITGLVIPSPGCETWAFRKLTVTERPVVNVALVHVPEPRRPGAAWRLVVGAVTERPSLFEAQSLDDLEPESIVAGLDVVPDHGGSAAYKSSVTETLVRRVIAEVSSKVRGEARDVD